MMCNLKRIGELSLLLAFAGALTAATLTGCNGGAFNKKAAINLLSREEGSGTRGAFVEIFGIEKKNSSGKKVDYTSEDAAITNSTAVMLTTVAGDKAAIGYVSLGSLNSSVKALKIDGVEASVSNIQNSSYKISRPFNVAVKEGLSPAAEDFLNFVLSEEGQEIVEENKCIPIANPGDYECNGSSGKVVVSGSSSVSPVMEKLIEEYKSENPKVTVELQTSDSTTGVTNAINGNCDLGMASRGLKDSEKAKGVKEITIAIDGIAVIVNIQNPTENMSKAQVEKIFTGKVSKWSEIIK